MEEDNCLDMMLFQAIYDKHSELYPDRLQPGITPKDPFVYVLVTEIELLQIEEVKKQNRLLYKEGSIYKEIDLRKSPEMIEQKYYHDGILIDWDNIKKSNNAYMKRIKNCHITKLYTTQ